MKWPLPPIWKPPPKRGVDAAREILGLPLFLPGFGAADIAGTVLLSPCQGVRDSWALVLRSGDAIRGLLGYLCTAPPVV